MARKHLMYLLPPLLAALLLSPGPCHAFLAPSSSRLFLAHRDVAKTRRGARRERAVSTMQVELTWYTKGGDLYVKDAEGKAPADPFVLKGVNWSGFESQARQAGGTNAGYPVEDIVGFIKYWGFNAVRLPISLPMALNFGTRRDSKNAQDFLAVIRALGRQGILVMLDMHRLSDQEDIFFKPGENDANAKLQGALWYTTDPDPRLVKHTQADFEAGWKALMDLCQDEWNLFAIDLKNEPSKPAKWENYQLVDNENKDWNLFAENLIKKLAKEHPKFKGYFFVEGVQTDNSGWGGDISAINKEKANLPIRPGEANVNRVVYSPHVYGPSAWWRDYHKYLGGSESDWAKVFSVWTEQWGFARKQGYAVVIGEWGGWNNRRAKPKDEEHHKDAWDGLWHRAMVLYMRLNGYRNQFYWVLNPGFGDTGGLVDGQPTDDGGAPWPPRTDEGRSLKAEYTKMQLLGVTVLNRQNYPDLPASPPEYGLYCPAYPSEDATKLLPTSLEYKDGVLKWGRWKGPNQHFYN